ncbi:MAG: hypothetical protein LBJ08_01175 [Bifidobacteriaceae bacterium]|nr:hypothetical protein [Bifidobacteriaceae bacterium]
MAIRQAPVVVTKSSMAIRRVLAVVAEVRPDSTLHGTLRGTKPRALSTISSASSLFGTQP